MRTLRLLGLLALLCPQLARAQAAPAETPEKRAPAASTPAANATTKPAPAKPTSAKPAKVTKPAPETAAAPAAPAPVAPPAPPGVFPQAAAVGPAPEETPPPPPPIAGGYPYGYGYGYTPPPADPQRQKTLTELQQVDLRIASVKREQRQHSLVGPVAMTGSGYLVAAAFGVAAVLEWAIAQDIRHDDCGYSYNRRTRDYEDRCDVNNNGVVTKADEHDARVMARTFGAISAVGAGVGIVGTVLLMRQLAKRREHSPELYQLGTRRGQLLQQLRYGGGYSSNGLTLGVSGKF